MGYLLRRLQRLPAKINARNGYLSVHCVVSAALLQQLWEVERQLTKSGVNGTNYPSPFQNQVILRDVKQ